MLARIEVEFYVHFSWYFYTFLLPTERRKKGRLEKEMDFKRDMILIFE